MENNIRISVAMTTYNGEKYIAKQLESFICQTRLPDEVIICDDGSKDNTVSIINEFVRERHLINWKVLVNSPNLGWKANFYKAASLTSGSVIFFSDQDDIWCPDKIEVMYNMMVSYNMGCLYAEKTIIDSQDNVITSRQDKSHYTGKITKIPLKHSFYELKTLGCCMCVTRELLDLYLSVNFPEGGHDSQCGRLAVLTTTLWHYDYPVIMYRIHDHNSSGISGVASFGQSDLRTRLDGIEVTISWMLRLVGTLQLDKSKLNFLQDCRKFLENRLLFFKGKRSVLYLIKYFKFYRDFSMFCGDIAYKYDLNKSLGKLRWKIKKICRS